MTTVNATSLGEETDLFIKVYGYEFGSGDAYKSGAVLRSKDEEIDRLMHPEGDGSHLNRCGSEPTVFKVGIVLFQTEKYRLSRPIKGSWAEEKIIETLRGWAYEADCNNDIRTGARPREKHTWATIDRNRIHPDKGWCFPLPNYYWRAWQRNEIEKLEKEIRLAESKIKNATAKIERTKKYEFNTYY